MYFSVGDASYYYEISGEGPPVVLLHGFTGSHHTWSTLISKWKKDFQVITIDLPGHGKTVADTIRTMESCCDDLKHLFDHIKLTKFHLLGYSMGGRTALSFGMFYPEYITSLILESASPGLCSTKEQTERRLNDEKLAQRIETAGVKSFVQFWESIPLFASQRELPTHIQDAIRQERLSQSEAGLASSLRGMGTGSQPSWWKALMTFTKPVLLMAGEKDEKFVKINKEMLQSFPEADLEIVEDVGHAIHVEDPEKFGKLVRAFILNHNAQGGF